MQDIDCKITSYIIVSVLFPYRFEKVKSIKEKLKREKFNILYIIFVNLLNLFK